MSGKRNCEKIDKGLYKRYSKGENRYSLLYKFAVAPCAGAWVEMLARRTRPFGLVVAPRTGAWVEIMAMA